MERAEKVGSVLCIVGYAWFLLFFAFNFLSRFGSEMYLLEKHGEDT